MLKRLGIIAFFMALAIVAVETFTVEFGIDGLTYLPRETSYRGRPFTGMTYKFHSNSWNLYKLQFFWKGKQVGVEQRWFANGVKWQELSFHMGLRQGTHKAWYSSGKVHFLKTYSQGQLEGEYWAWHPNGVVSDFHVFKNGEQLVYKSFISDGKPFYNYVYSNGKRIGLEGGNFCKATSI